jgi:hypothetical protein
MTREQMRRWMDNWRAVNAAQDELVRAAPPPDPVACLELGLSMIALALDANAGPRIDSQEADDAVTDVWRRLRAAHRR